jgi:hypothetical protein
MNINKRRGRPSLLEGEKKVLFARRLSPKQMEEVTAALAGGSSGEAPIVKGPPKLCVVEVSKDWEITKLKEQNYRLAGENAKLAEEVMDLRDRLERSETLAGAASAMQLTMLKAELADLRNKAKQYEIMLNGS